MKVMTYNIKFPDAKVKGKKRWPARREAVVRLIKHQRADVVALQEAWKTKAGDWMPFLRQRLPAYASSARLGNAILYKRDRYRLVAQGARQLPHAKCLRYDPTRHYQWVRLEDRRTKKTVYVGNFHATFMQQCGAARRADARNLHRVIKQTRVGTEPIILAGDFNNVPGDGSLKIIGTRQGGIAPYKLRATLAGSHRQPTYNKRWDGKRSNDYRRIDYLFVSGALSVIAHRRETGFFGMGTISPSDHYAVMARVSSR